MTKTKFKIYKDRKGEFRWRAVRVGRIVADSAEGYRRKSSCVKTLTNFVTSVNRGRYEVVKC